MQRRTSDSPETGGEPSPVTSRRAGVSNLVARSPQLGRPESPQALWRLAGPPLNTRDIRYNALSRWLRPPSLATRVLDASNFGSSPLLLMSWLAVKKFFFPSEAEVGPTDLVNISRKGAASGSAIKVLIIIGSAPAHPISFCKAAVFGANIKTGKSYFKSTHVTRHTLTFPRFISCSCIAWKLSFNDMSVSW